MPRLSLAPRRHSRAAPSTRSPLPSRSQVQVQDQVQVQVQVQVAQATDFSSLGLHPQLLKALTSEGYTHPTPIQAQSVPVILQGHDLIGCAQTGTGKTAAFALPILQRLMMQGTSEGQGRKSHSPQTLVVTPTRELALQIHESFCVYGRHTNLKSAVIFGGVGQRAQTDALARHPEILVATPGRLLDLLNQRYVNLKAVSVLVIDEADRMLDMGFILDVKRIIKALPVERQTLLFSATMPTDILNLASHILRDPIKVAVDPVSSVRASISQKVYFVDKKNKCTLLQHLLQDKTLSRVLVFTRTKHIANEVTDYLENIGVRSRAIHSNKSQRARQEALAGFKKGTIRVLVASDIASRGIDVDSISHVINFNIPNVPETFVHRVGRTARAESTGIALSFCANEERSYLANIERHLRSRIPVETDHPKAARAKA